MKITLLIILFLSFSESCFQSKKINTYLDFGLKYMQNGSCTQYPALLNLTLTLKNGIVNGKILFPPTFKLVNNVKLILDIANNGTCTNCINNYTPYSQFQCITNFPDASGTPVGSCTCKKYSPRLAPVRLMSIS